MPSDQRYVSARRMQTPEAGQDLERIRVDSGMRRTQAQAGQEGRLALPRAAAAEHDDVRRQAAPVGQAHASVVHLCGGAEQVLHSAVARAGEVAVVRLACRKVGSAGQGQGRHRAGLARTGRAGQVCAPGGGAAAAGACAALWLRAAYVQPVRVDGRTLWCQAAPTGLSCHAAGVRIELVAGGRKPEHTVTHARLARAGGHGRGAPVNTMSAGAQSGTRCARPQGR
jgi:hypothetical protein